MEAEVTISLVEGRMGASDQYILRIEKSGESDKINFLPLKKIDAEILSRFFDLDLPVKETKSRGYYTAS